MAKMKLLDGNLSSHDPSGVWIRIPCVVSVDDYHELDDLATTLNKLNSGSHLAGRRVKAKELGMLDGRYVGLLYIGSLTRSPDTKRMMREWERKCS